MSIVVIHVFGQLLVVVDLQRVTTAMSLQRPHQLLVQIQNLLHQQTQTYNLPHIHCN